MIKKIQARLQRIEEDLKFFTERMEKGIMPLSCAATIKNLECQKRRYLLDLSDWQPA